MRFSFSRSVKFGPLRVNVSKRGVGLSAGVKGARVSVGPRGTLVTLGRGGFRYQTSFGASPRQTSGRVPEAHVPTGVEAAVGEVKGRIATASVDELAEASPQQVMDEINFRTHRFSWTGPFLVGSVVVAILTSLNPFVLALLLVAGYLVYRWDEERRTARLVYDLDDEAVVSRWSLCNAAGESLSHTERLWHIYASQSVGDRKRNAGASALISRTSIRCQTGSLPLIELNVEPWSVKLGPQQLLFLPDRLLVHENKKFAPIPYEDLASHVQRSNFIEEETVPRDSRQVDTTWRYVNKSGGPDRRFNNNVQLPVMEYGRITLSSKSGMTVVLESSNPAAVDRAKAALDALRAAAIEIRSAPQARQVRREEKPLPPPQGANAVVTTAVLQAAATVLRFVASADRRISDEEVSSVFTILSQMSSDPALVSDVVARFRTLPSGDAEVRDALAHLERRVPGAAARIVAAGAELASADGKVTPKERERLSQLQAWAASIETTPG